MKTIIFKISLLLFLTPLLALSSNEFNGRYTKEKKISKSFSVAADALLHVDNKYGNIDITTWDQNRVEIEVSIKTNGDDEEKVSQRLREIDVAFQNSRNRVSAETLLEQRDVSWWSQLFGSSSNVNLEINYRIKAPVTNNVDLSNDYGSINIDRLEGNAKISCDYGRLFIGELLGAENELEFDYTRNSHIGYIKNAKIDADYSEYTIEEAESLEISADYTRSNIEKVEHLEFSCDYGGINIGMAKNIRGNGDYLSTDIGSIYSSLLLSLDYGSASIGRIMKGAKTISIDSDYTSLKIGHAADFAFTFSVSTSYAKVRGLEGEDFVVNKRRQSNTKDFYEGHYISSSGGSVNIESSYGSVSFNTRN